jgi:hypothetical protein
MPSPKLLQSLIIKIRKGFNLGLIPQLTDEGTNGTYELRGFNNKKLAIFKPIDEEVNAPNNPRGNTAAFGTTTFREGILSGESSIREVAAYLIDLRS